jgi:hypothetical protein
MTAEDAEKGIFDDSAISVSCGEFSSFL